MSYPDADLALRGVIPAMVTPFDRRERVDGRALQDLVDFLVMHRVDGLFVCGTTGEGPLLSPSEHGRVVSGTVDAAAGRIPVIAHVGAARSETACALAKSAVKHGASAVAATTPYYYQLNDEELEQHFRRVSQAVDVPFFLYNIPANTGHRISATLAGRLAEALPVLAGIKDSSGDRQLLLDLLQIDRRRLDVLVGTDSLDRWALEAGAQGLVSSMAGIFPELYVMLYNSVRTGEVQTAHRCQEAIDLVSHFLGNGRYPGRFKWALGRRGLSVGPPRRPLSPFTDPDDATWKEIVHVVEATLGHRIDE